MPTATLRGPRHPAMDMPQIEVARYFRGSRRYLQHLDTMVLCREAPRSAVTHRYRRPSRPAGARHPCRGSATLCTSSAPRGTGTFRARRLAPRAPSRDSTTKGSAARVREATIRRSANACGPGGDRERLGHAHRRGHALPLLLRERRGVLGRAHPLLRPPRVEYLPHGDIARSPSLDGATAGALAERSGVVSPATVVLLSVRARLAGTSLARSRRRPGRAVVPSSAPARRGSDR